MANPCLLHLPLRENLEGRDRNGVVTATASGPVRFTEDGYYAEEGTTNYVKNPRAAEDTAGATTAGAGATVERIAGASSQLDSDYVYRLTTAAASATEALIIDCADFLTTGVALASDVTFTLSYDVVFYTGSKHKAAIRWNNGPDTGGVDQPLTLGVPTRIEHTDVVPAGTTVNAGSLEVIIYTRTSSVGDAVSMDISNIQVELKAYATSFCDGSVGTGYSWAGTAHASASSRAASYAYVSETARIAAAAGSIALRLTRKTDTGANQTLIDVGDGTASKDRLTVRVNSSDQAQMAWASNGAAATTVTEPDPTATVDTERIVYAEWDATDTGISVDNTTLVTGVRDAAQGDLSSANDLLIGALAGGSAYADSQISDLLIFDRPLTNAERVNLAAIDEWSFDVLQPKFGGVLRIGTGIGLAISSVAAPAAVAVARTLGGL